MEYGEAANVLFDLRRFPPRPGTEATADLLAHLGDPHESLTCVQVAGSNGKGSTARMVERALREAGVSVGLYTSPHLDDVRERVRVDGRPIREAAVIEYVEAVREYATDRAVDGDAPTFFEALTALACWEFDRQDVDVAVLEVGIGGRYDATSVVDPVASAVTTVTLEHTDLLGDTVADIAREKAVVAPEGTPLVTAATGEALAAIREATAPTVTVGLASEAGDGDGPDAPTVTVEYGGRAGVEGQVAIAGPDWHVETPIPLLGTYQARNAGIAATLVRQVGRALDHDIDRSTLERGLRNAHWPGRFEVMRQAPLVVLDGAHNPAACASTVQTLSSFAYADLHLVVGAMADKDHRGMAAAFAPAGPTRVHACQAAHVRAEDPAVIAAAFAEETDATVETCDHVSTGLSQALADAEPDDAVVVAGSLYVVAAARARWTRTPTRPRIETRADALETLARAHVPASERPAMADAAVHRVLRMRVRAGQAPQVKQALLAAGGSAAVSAIAEQDQEAVDVVVMATREQFETATRALASDSVSLPAVAADIRAAIDGRAGEVGTAGQPRRSAESSRERWRDAARPTAPTAPGTDAPSPDRGYPWEAETAVMGILNITPDSFHDGGEYDTVTAARERAERMVEAGVSILDIGGESTRPCAEPVPADVERDRVVPVIEAVADLDVMVSIDTRKASVARAALRAGAALLNDVSGLADPEMRLVAADHDVPVVVMHSTEVPVDPTASVQYDDVVGDVIDELAERVILAEKAGLDRSQILVDPGLGFGKTAVECFEIIDRLDEFRALGCPILVGHSHKSMFQLIAGEGAEVLDETVAATALLAERGADVIRVHDADENVAAVRVAQAVADPARFVE